jgi:hypothetical protein
VQKIIVCHPQNFTPFLECRIKSHNFKGSNPTSRDKR